MQLPKDFSEFIALMNSAGVRYVTVGAYALNLYRPPRLTGDIDFFVESGEPNETLLRSVLNDFGFGSVVPPAGVSLLSPNKVIMLGRSPFRIDLLTQISGVTFDDAYSSRRVVDVDGQPVLVISPELLLKNKEAAARPKDLADVADLRGWFSRTMPETDD